MDFISVLVISRHISRNNTNKPKRINTFPLNLHPFPFYSPCKLPLYRTNFPFTSLTPNFTSF